jgi:hypothetical protein
MRRLAFIAGTAVTAALCLLDQLALRPTLSQRP